MAQETYLSELKVLLRRSPECRDENLWPMFDLIDVEVKAKDGRLVSLFCANSQQPVTVYGTLVVKGAFKMRNAILPDHRSQTHIPIKIKDCNYFAYGAYTNGEIAVWASGKAGWHKIHPASTYADIFLSMTKAVETMYFLIDCYRDDQNLNYKEVFRQYSEIHNISVKEAMTQFYTHAAFLASRMVQGEEEIVWASTSFYQHLRRVKPEVFDGRSSDTVAGAFPSLMLGLVSEPAPCLESNAPGDMWCCPYTGCVHKVYGASEEENKDFIRDHLLKHGASLEVDSITTEQSTQLTRLPVSRLLRRIRDMAERDNVEQVRIGDRLVDFPPPLRKLIS